MEVIQNLSSELTKALDVYRTWVTQEQVQSALTNKLNVNVGKLFKENRGNEAVSLDYLMQIDHQNHSGLPADTYGYNLDYAVVKQNRTHVESGFYDEIREINHVLDDQLQLILGARTCALKMYYPAGGYIDWHTNWDVPGYNAIFTYSPSGNGFWRHIDSSKASGLKPSPDNLVHIDDVPGWHCKLGYFGRKDEAQKIVWHSAFTSEPRITISYLIFDRAIWESLREELTAK